MRSDSWIGNNIRLKTKPPVTTMFVSVCRQSDVDTGTLWRCRYSVHKLVDTIRYGDFKYRISSLHYGDVSTRHRIFWLIWELGVI